MSLLGLLLAAGCLGPSPASPEVVERAQVAAEVPDPVPANWLVIVADDLGTDKVGAYGEHPGAPPTPSIDRLAAEGVLFRNAYAYPTCSASRAALLTGRYGRRTGIGGIVELEVDTYELPLAEVLIPELLDRDEEPWATAAVGKWHLSGHKTRHGFDHPNLQGFDHYSGVLGNLVATSRDYGMPGDYSNFEKVTNGSVEFVRKRYVTVDTAEDALAQLDALEPPWLLYVAFNAPHTPYDLPPATLYPSPALGRDADGPARFSAIVQAMDRQIGRLLDAMDPQTRDSTYVVFLGDNGTENAVVLPPLDPKRAKQTLFEGGTNVPLIVSGPDVPRGVEAWALVHVVDLLPTVAELARVPTDDLVLDGVSFASVLRDPTQDGPRRTVFTERFRPLGRGPYDRDLVALRDDRYKIVRDRRGRFQMYDLQGRFDDGDGRPRDRLRGAERERFDALKDELEATLASLEFAH